MVVLGLLQNQWFRDPARAAALLALYEARPDHGRAAFVRDMLFLGGLTGARIKAVFGVPAALRIVWEESSPVMGQRASDVFPVDHDHVRAALELHRPAVVVAFGRVPGSAFAGSPAPPAWAWVKEHSAVVIRAPHPAARGRLAANSLADAAAHLRRVVPELFAPVKAEG